MAASVPPVPPAPSDPQGEPCDVCGAPTFELHCKVMCKRCGYTRDCGDP